MTVADEHRPHHSRDARSVERKQRLSSPRCRCSRTSKSRGRPTLLNSTKRSPLRPIPSGREFCGFVIAAVRSGEVSAVLPGQDADRGYCFAIFAPGALMLSAVRRVTKMSKNVIMSPITDSCRRSAATSHGRDE